MRACKSTSTLTRPSPHKPINPIRTVTRRLNRLFLFCDSWQLHVFTLRNPIELWDKRFSWLDLPACPHPGWRMNVQFPSAVYDVDEALDTNQQESLSDKFDVETRKRRVIIDSLWPVSYIQDHSCDTFECFSLPWGLIPRCSTWRLLYCLSHLVIQNSQVCSKWQENGTHASHTAKSGTEP